ncbi:MAG: Gfo/Idh/MocA family oxidoreductase [Bacteroidetes bacterium]|nr:Gfo/Idh/MocA family oxidoreductase [Bacteroidota bacterium]
MSHSRRRFIKHAATVVSSVAILPVIPSLRFLHTAPVAPSDTLLFGVIGCNGMGFSDTRSLLKNPNTQCIAVCDVDTNVSDRRAKNLVEMGGPAPQIYGDYRQMLENKDLDFVVIGTPDHWHCLNLVDALEAGKHVYVEKPLANSIHECDVMLRAATHHGKVVQMGQWQRSGPHWQNAIEFVHSGALGKIRTVKTWAYQGWMKPVPMYADEAAPDGVNYDMWLGPAASRPFNRNRFHFNFRWFWDYAGGLMTDWGVHIIDFALYGMKATYPKSVMASGGKFAYPDDASETPDTLQAVYEFDDFTMLWEHATGIDLGPYGRTHGVAFIGNNGTAIIDRGGWEVIPEEEYDPDLEASVPKLIVPDPTPRSGNDLDRHTKNFISAITTGEELNGGIKVGHSAAVVAHMGNVAFKTGRKVHWENGSFRNDKEANALLTPTYRSPWSLPNY